ncbi:hypothetical protein ECIV_ORF108 [European chub iridovirus]|nr:hypothetical protein ECIV_ORF108 [European chub iridovirus]
MYVNNLLHARGYDVTQIMKVSCTEYVIPNFVHVVDSSAIRVNAIVINDIRERINEKIAIILYLHATHEALKKSEGPIRLDSFDQVHGENDSPIIELFNISYLLFDLTSQIPTYSRYHPVQKYKKNAIPQIKADDPSVKYYGFNSGDYISVQDEWHEMIYFVV